ncbi:hypothetical protein IX335_001009 [Porphyromonas levii]|uniref:DUF6078 family protein n=1 Tax=Porphyromonas levii TaxID=28114 RepID=UPI0031FEAC75|nr:hypothetical protein [Porphyromonas levii]
MISIFYYTHFSVQTTTMTERYTRSTFTTYTTYRMEHFSCYTPNCPRRESCTLWQNALLEIEHEAKLLSLTNPRLIEKAGGYDHCPNYHEYKLRRFARGLVWTYDDLTIAQWRDIRSELSAHFSKSAITRMRCGYEAISPEEQELIAHIFDSAAPGSKPRYITYEEHYTKPPRVEGKAAHELLHS